MRSFVWQMVFSKWRINLANFTLHIGQISSVQNVVEIKQRLFCQTMCTGNLLFGAQWLVK